MQTATEAKVWAAWNALPDTIKYPQSPVKTVARQLGMTASDVAFVVFPAEVFGRWSDDQEPDLP